MEGRIDINRLRRDLKDYYGTAMVGGFPMAMMDVSQVERASADELIELAQSCGIDINKYIEWE